MSKPIGTGWPPERDLLEMALDPAETDEDIAFGLEQWAAPLHESGLAVQVAYKVETDVIQFRHSRLTSGYCLTGEGLARVGRLYGGAMPKSGGGEQIERFARQVMNEAWKRARHRVETSTLNDAEQNAKFARQAQDRRAELAAACGDW